MKALMRSRLKKAGIVGAVAAFVIAGFVVTLQPASAGHICDVRTYWYKGNKAQVDNCPGNGKQSWAWVWDGVRDPFGVYLDVQFYDGTWGSIGKPDRGNVDCERNDCAQGRGDAAAFSFDKDIWRARICRYDNNLAGYGINRGCARPR